ncbi:hypothetical protein [Psychrobacillus sp. FJAT-51614]
MRVQTLIEGIASTESFLLTDVLFEQVAACKGSFFPIELTQQVS